LHANEILNQLRQNVIDSLHQTGKAEETKDGMDISLCVIDIENKHLQYAGAHNPVYIVRNNELIQLEADKMPIGIYKTDTSFTNHELFLEYNDMIYLFSDGYYDQFGGHAGTKFFSFNFRKLLLEIHQKPLNVQKQILDEKYEEWKGSHEQLDDVMVIGLKIIPHKIFSPKVEENAWPDKIILIAEDVDINYFLLVEALKPTKTKLVRVTNGEEAVEYCRKNHVDLILMDIRMPVMDGREATMLIKQFNKNLPIIAQTAQNEPGDKEILLNAGCDDFIAKPIDQKLFISLIRKHLLNS
jgi:CheY-like chemotaxis protein